MGLFLVIAAPFWFILIVSFYPKPSRGWRGVLVPLGWGLLTGMASLSLTLGLLTRIPFAVEPMPLYSWAWIRGPGWPFLAAVAVMIAVYVRRPTAYSRIRELSAWTAGLATVYLIWYALVRDPGFDSYRVLVAPLVTLSAAAAVAWLLDRGLRLEGGIRIVLFAAAALVPMVLTFIPVLFALGEVLAAWILAPMLMTGFTVLTYLDSRGRLS